MLNWFFHHGENKPNWTIFAGKNYSYISKITEFMTHSDTKLRSFPRGTIPGNYPEVSLLIRDNSRKRKNRFNLCVLDYAGELIGQYMKAEDGITVYESIEPMKPLEISLEAAKGIIILLDSLFQKAVFREVLRALNSLPFCKIE